MKKKVAIGLIALLSVSFVFFGCGSSDGDPTGSTTYTVTFDSNGGSVVEAISGVASGAKIKAPADPTRSGYTFVGWYKEKALTNEWKFGTDVVEADITLYAGWKSLAGELANDPALGGNVTVSGTTVTLTGTVTLSDDLSIPAGVTLKTNGNNLTIPSGMDLEVVGNIEVNGGTLTFAAGAAGDLKGTITVGSGSILVDENPLGSLWLNSSSTGKYVYAAGATAKVGPGGAVVKIGSDSDTDAIIQLTSGTFTNTRTDYLLEGDVTLNRGYGLTEGTFTIAENRTLTVELTHVGVGPVGLDAGAYVLGSSRIVGKSGAVIEIKSPVGVTGGLIYVDNAPGDIFYDNTPDHITHNYSTPNLYTEVPIGTYDWNASLGSGGGWKAQ